MGNLLKISLYTILDQMRHKSFYVLLAISILFVLMIRGCYNADFSVNGQKVDNVTLAWHASKVVFHAIAFGMFLMTALLTMRTYTHDKTDGSLTMFLSRPVARRQYAFGRVAGTWILVTVFMLILHFTIFLTAWMKTGGIIPGYLTASLVCSVNLLFVVLMVFLLSMHMPDFIAALVTLAVIIIGFISDGGYQVMQTDAAKSILPENITNTPALWRVLYPKICSLQNWAVSLIDKSDFTAMGPVHPVLNVLFFIVVLGALLFWSMDKREV
jgi:ABC-type transport system involved in multi-copper enzyme maturation permease subunit